MIIYDFNIHFGVNSGRPQMSYEASLTLDMILQELETFKKIFPRNIKRVNGMMFAFDIVQSEYALSAVCEKMNEHFPQSSITALVNFRSLAACKIESFLSSPFLRGIKFHSYFQRITESDFPSIINIARQAEKRGLFICVDTSFGTSGMYRFDNMKLACELADEVACPIILLHSGGKRVIDAMLLAEEKKNVFLETSFSLPYYEGASVQDDIVFAFKKLGASRLIYGSDYPYVSLEESEKIALRFLNRCDFSNDEIRSVMFDNAVELMA